MLPDYGVAVFDYWHYWREFSTWVSLNADWQNVWFAGLGGALLLATWATFAYLLRNHKPGGAVFRWPLFLLLMLAPLAILELVFVGVPVAMAEAFHWSGFTAGGGRLKGWIFLTLLTLTVWWAVYGAVIKFTLKWVFEPLRQICPNPVNGQKAFLGAFWVVRAAWYLPFCVGVYYEPDTILIAAVLMALLSVPTWFMIHQMNENLGHREFEREIARARRKAAKENAAAEEDDQPSMEQAA